MSLLSEMYDVAVFFKALFGVDAFEYFIYMYRYFAFQILGLLHSYLMFYSENIYDHFNQDSVPYYLFLIITHFEWKSKNSSYILLCFSQHIYHCTSASCVLVSALRVKRAVDYLHVMCKQLDKRKDLVWNKTLFCHGMYGTV